MSERDEFERFITDKFFDIKKDHIGYTSWATAFAWKVWQDTRAAARAPQAVPALTEPVAWHIGNPDGTMNKLGAIYHHRQSAVDHFDSYGGDFNASIVPLYAATQPSQEPEKAPHRYQD